MRHPRRPRGLDRLRALLEARTPRPWTGTRALRMTLRTVHLLTASALYGAVLFQVDDGGRTATLHAVAVSGSAFVAFELWRSPAWLVQVRGLATVSKVLVLAAAFATDRLVLTACTLALVTGVVTSHAPARVRYHSVLHGRELGSDGRG